ncbi:UNVERIFIED_ORG: hypothetical protein FHR35_001923 [Microbispora rosea subsp. rosea]
MCVTEVFKEEEGHLPLVTLQILQYIGYSMPVS